MPTRSSAPADSDRTVAAKLRALVVSDADRWDSPVSISDLAQQLGASEPQVTEAVAHVARDGFLRLLADDRVALREWTVEDLDEVVQIRLLLEPAALRFAAQHIRLVDLLTLRELVAEVGLAEASGDFAAFRQAADVFKITFLSFVPNRRLAHLVTDLRHATEVDGLQALIEVGAEVNMEAEYSRLLDLVEAGDLDAVETWARGRVGVLRYLGAPRMDAVQPAVYVETGPVDAMPFEGDWDADDAGV